jgi:hypothetical protein
MPHRNSKHETLKIRNAEMELNGKELRAKGEGRRAKSKEESKERRFVTAGKGRR